MARSLKKKINPANGNDKNRLLCAEFAVNERETTLEFGNDGQLENEELRRIQGFEQKDGVLTLKATKNEVVKISGEDVGAIPGKEKRERRNGDEVLSVVLVDIDKIMKTIVKPNAKSADKDDDMEK